MITHNRLKELVHYDSISGLFTHIAVRKKVKVGDIVGSINSKGYVIIKLDKISYYAHRLAWFYMTGKWPENEIDHKDLNKSYNAWDNLREATRRQNMQNRGVKRDSTTKIKGVKLTPDNTYTATISLNNKKLHLGTFKTIEKAKSAYENAARFYNGNFVRIN